MEIAHHFDPHTPDAAWRRTTPDVPDAPEWRHHVDRLALVAGPLLVGVLIASLIHWWLTGVDPEWLTLCVTITFTAGCCTSLFYSWIRARERRMMAHVTSAYHAGMITTVVEVRAMRDEILERQLVLGQRFAKLEEAAELVGEAADGILEIAAYQESIAVRLAKLEEIASMGGGTAEVREHLARLDGAVEMIQGQISAAVAGTFDPATKANLIELNREISQR